MFQQLYKLYKYLIKIYYRTFRPLKKFFAKLRRSLSYESLLAFFFHSLRIIITLAFKLWELLKFVLEPFFSFFFRILRAIKYVVKNAWAKFKALLKLVFKPLFNFFGRNWRSFKNIPGKFRHYYKKILKFFSRIERTLKMTPFTPYKIKRFLVKWHSIFLAWHSNFSFSRDFLRPFCDRVKHFLAKLHFAFCFYRDLVLLVHESELRQLKRQRDFLLHCYFYTYTMFFKYIEELFRAKFKFTTTADMDYEEEENSGLWSTFFFVYMFSSLVVLHLGDFGQWVYLFQDPATAYAHAMIDLHDLSMWYIFIVLGVVCWSLYAILKNGFWYISNKSYGISGFFYLLPIFYQFESFFVYWWVKFTIDYGKPIFEHLLEQSIVEMLIHSYLKLDTSFYAESLYFFIGNKSFIEGLDYPEVFDKITYVMVEDIVVDKYLDFLLFRVRTYGEFFYDDFSPVLAVRRFRHSLLLEFIWASFPTLIIILILIPSLFLLYSAEEDLDPEMTLKVIGHQWFWSYEYSDYFTYIFGSFKAMEFKEFSFDSYLVLEEDLPFGARRLLEVNNRVVLPTNTVLRFVITSGDVLHSWAVPEMGLKVDAVPGRLNQCLSFIVRPGIFYGQCSELCGVAHGFMPIVVHAVPPKDFSFWIFWTV